MQFLKFNGQTVDIDNETSIGVTFQAYDFSDPAKRVVSVSNSFSLPATANNLRVIKHTGNAQSTSLIVYDSLLCDYWIDNFKVIDGGKARITKIGKRIECFLTEKTDIWDRLKEIKWYEFQETLLTWLQSKGVPSISDPYTGNFIDFIEPYTTSTSGLIIPYYLGNLGMYSQIEGQPAVENVNELYLSHTSNVYEDGKGGHICVYLKTIFQCIEEVYGVNFGVNETFDNNIFDDEIFKRMYIPARMLMCEVIDNITTKLFYFKYSNLPFIPHEIENDCQEKTMYDLISNIFKHFNCIIDKDEHYFIHRFDDIENAPIVELSSEFVNKEFSPTIPGYAQINRIKFEKIYENGSELLNSKLIECKNKNIDKEKDLFKIDGYISKGLINNLAPDLSDEEAFDTFSFLIDNGTITANVVMYQKDVSYETTPITLKKSAHYSLDDEYNTLAKMVEYPVFYKVEKWLNLNDIFQLKFFRKYFIRELNGYFFINKISGYNPKSQKATTIELIKI